MSVGTREQLSTLYRLSLAEYLQTVLVLDDQLVQSDETRMDWFRELLKEKSRTFQIVVFTCRPRDYLGKTAMVPKGKGLFADPDEGIHKGVRPWKSIEATTRESQDPTVGTRTWKRTENKAAQYIDT